MDHVRSVCLPIFGNVGQIEPLRHIPVELNSCALPVTPECIADFQIDFRPVERTTASIDLVWQMALLQRATQVSLGSVPELWPPHRLFRAGREKHLKARKAKGTQDLQGQVDHPEDLIVDLIRAAEDVSIVLSEATHP